MLMEALVSNVVECKISPRGFFTSRTPRNSISDSLELSCSCIPPKYYCMEEQLQFHGGGWLSLLLPMGAGEDVLSIGTCGHVN